ncbi:universal stress protein [Rhizobacter sp. J219]|jgi:nucleotide-binding universal stress UspA family protein|uniref:universal stress protein n=1 Tax=Rhizobacter sp. J219 TaxID=2898430 RepID=UPI002150DA85|nr:universal stress protein [Rhizobacter sp. J219]MCR5886037.1 universal stress protein [Rhizobacter sp. J219]
MDTPKTLLLHVDDNPGCTEHARTVQRLAERFDAQAQVLYAVTPSVARFPASTALDGSYMAAAQLDEFDKQQRALTKIRLITALKELPRVHWCEAVRTTSWDFPLQAMYVDLVVMRGGAAAQNELPPDYAAAVAIDSGRPVLVLPATPPAEIGTTVLVAWKPTRESVRAVAHALPWLKQAHRVHLVTAETLDDSGPASAMRIAQYLSAHGVECVMAPPLPDTRDAASALRSLAAEVDADLLVMGCYGHSRTREWLLGGTTKSMTRDPGLPVLMAH